MLIIQIEYSENLKNRKEPMLSSLSEKKQKYFVVQPILLLFGKCLTASQK